MPSTTANVPADRAAPRLLAREHLPVVLGVISLVTLGAFENRAVVSILPTVVRAIDGWSLFGAAGGAPLATFAVAMAYAGSWTDRVGPRRVLLTGLATFVGAQVVSGLAPTMWVLVLGRATSGAAEAFLDTALTVLVAQVLPEALRAKVFAALAAAWVLPSLLGPAVAGGIDALAGWRAVFVGPLLVVPVALALVRSGLRRTAPPDEPTSEPAEEARRMRAALVLAAGLVATTFAGPLVADPERRATGLVVAGIGLVVLLASARSVLPAGTARFACGIPSVVALRFVVAVAFTGIGSTIPLMLTTTRGVGPAVAGVSLAVTGTLWAAGSWLVSLAAVQRVTTSTTRLRIGFAAIALGAAGPVLLSLGSVGLGGGMSGWAVSALGMGIVSPTLSTEQLALAGATEQGRASAAAGLAGSVGVAVPTAVAGAVVALRGPAMDGASYAAIMAAAALVAAVGSVAAGRLRSCAG